MTINELRQLTFFRHADIQAINEDNNDLTVSFDDEIVDISEIEVGYVPERFDIMVIPKRFVRVYCMVKSKKTFVQPVKHGYWKEEEPRVLKCSVCGEYAPMNYLGQNCIDSSYCPWCGTKMDSNADEPWQSE